MNIKQLFGGISVGKDTSNNFKISTTGLAVRKAGDNGFVAFDGTNLINVDGLVFDGGSDYVYKVPAKTVKAGDLIITNEDPLHTLFVKEVHDDKVNGLDPESGFEETYRPQNNLLRVQFFIKVVSLLDGFLDASDEGSLLPLLLLGGLGKDGGTNDTLSILLLSKALSGKSNDNNFLPFLLLSEQKGNAMETLILLSTLSGGSNPFSCLFGGNNEETGTKSRKST
jgi:hypothetical protein